MLRLIAFCLAVVVGISFDALPLRSEPLQVPPYEMVRTLQSLQAQAAQGNSHALAAQRTLLLQMEQEFLHAEPDVWQDPRNARAAVIHLLSGGHPDIMRALLQYEPAPAIEPKLMKAALAYVEGREQDVAELLSDVDPRDLPPSLGGHVALTMAAVTVRDAPETALTYLGIARLLMPGSLVEEAALRREVFIAGTLGDVERFQSLANRYLRRFRNSIYAGDFRRRFALAIDALGFAKSPEKFSLIESLLNEFDEDTQRNLYLRLSRTALLHGELEIVRKVAKHALPLAMDGSREQALFKIYLAGASLEADSIKSVRDMLWSVDKKLLRPDDLALMEAVYSVLNAVRHWPDPPANVIGEFGSYSKRNKPDDPSWMMPVMTSADRLIAETDALLKEVKEPRHDH